MSPDDIDVITLAVFDLLASLGYDQEDEDYDHLRDLLHAKLDPFVTRERNYN